MAKLVCLSAMAASQASGADSFLKRRMPVIYREEYKERIIFTEQNFESDSRYISETSYLSTKLNKHILFIDVEYNDEEFGQTIPLTII